MTLTPAWRAIVMAVSCSGPAMAQDLAQWRAPLAQETAAAWKGVDAAGFSSEGMLVGLELRRHAAPVSQGYWSTHLRAAYANAMSLWGMDGETVRASQVYVALLLDCDRAAWLLAGAYAITTEGRDTVLVPLAHAGLEADRAALDRVAGVACRDVRGDRTAQMQTAPAGAVLGQLPER